MKKEYNNIKSFIEDMHNDLSIADTVVEMGLVKKVILIFIYTIFINTKRPVLMYQPFISLVFILVY